MPISSLLLLSSTRAGVSPAPEPVLRRTRGRRQRIERHVRALPKIGAACNSQRADVPGGNMGAGPEGVGGERERLEGGARARIVAEQLIDGDDRVVGSPAGGLRHPTPAEGGARGPPT